MLPNRSKSSQNLRERGNNSALRRRRFSLVGDAIQRVFDKTFSSSKTRVGPSTEGDVFKENTLIKGNSKSNSSAFRVRKCHSCNDVSSAEFTLPNLDPILKTDLDISQNLEKEFVNTEFADNDGLFGEAEKDTFEEQEDCVFSENESEKQKPEIKAVKFDLGLKDNEQSSSSNSQTLSSKISNKIMGKAELLQKWKQRSKSCPTFPNSSLPSLKDSPNLKRCIVESIPEDREIGFNDGNCNHDNWESRDLKAIQISPRHSNERKLLEGSMTQEMGTSEVLVCRHPNCMEKNQERPYLLCTSCDHDIHNSPENTGHLVFDINKQKKGVGVTLSSGLSSPLPTANGVGDGNTSCESQITPMSSLLTEASRNAHSDNEADQTDGHIDDTDGVYLKKGELDGKGNSTARASKFRRKKAVKGRRHHTDLTHVLRRRSDVTLSSLISPVDGRRRHSMDEPESYDPGKRRASLNVDLMSLMTGVNHRKSESSIASFDPDTNQSPTQYPDDSAYQNDDPASHKSATQLRRHSVYKVNINDELITVHLPMEEGKPAQTEILAAIKNTTLRDAVLPLLDRRKVDFSSVGVFLDSSHTPLPWNCEIFLLGGKNLHVKDKDGESVLSRSKNLTSNKPQVMKETRPFVKPIGMYSRHGSVSDPESLYESDEDSRITFPRRSSLPFRERLMVDVKNEHPLARNQVQQTLSSSAQRLRRTNNLSADETTYSVIPAVSPHGTWSSSEGKKTSRPQTKLQQLFNPLSKDREKQDQLKELLNSYSVDGLPNLPDLMRVPGQRVYEDDLFQLDSHWSSLVANASSLTKRQHDQQEAIWELLQTEVHYIKALQVINELFTCVLLNLQQETLLNEIETEKLFSNVNEIYLSNCQFWTTHFLTVIEKARETRKPLDPSLLKDGFKKFGENFKPYTKYCLEQKPCLDYMKSRYRDNDLFKCFVVWAEAQKQCNRLKLTDLLVKPMQRLTKYSLLLQAILRKTEDDKQRRAVLEMIGNVDRFVTHVNGELRKRHEQERLGAIAGKIESYDAVEPPNEECKEAISQYSDLNLLDPMPGCDIHQPRCVIIQSGLKLKDAQMRIDVECLLFTDMLLLCKASKRMDKFKVIKPPMRVDKIIVQELRDKGSFLLLYLNEYRVPVSAFTFHSDTASIRVWIEHIKKAQDLYNEAKMASVKSSKEQIYSGENSPNSPNSFLGESLDSASFSRQQLNEPPPPSEPPPPLPVKRLRSYTVGSQDPDDGEKDEIDYVNVSGTLKRDILPRDDTAPPVEVFSPGNSMISPVIDGDTPSITTNSENRVKIIQQSMSLPVCQSNSNSSSDDNEFGFNSALGDEAAKLKLNQRRTSRTERRYHTADSIREIQRQNQDRDNSIYKRLSWNLGMVDISLDEKRGNLKNKAFSSDSLRSVPSSSGVSSTGSLHLSPESEISEESETNSIKASPATRLSITDGSDSPLDVSVEIPDVQSDHNLTVIESEQNTLSPEDKYAKSKSTSDIAALMSDLTKTKLKDGISSVELPKIGNNSKKLSYSQMLLVKKQLLLNSDLEASEV